MVKTLLTKWHLVTELFTMVPNIMVQAHSMSDHLNTNKVKTCYSDKFAIQMFAIQIPTVYPLFYQISFYLLNSVGSLVSQISIRS